MQLSRKTFLSGMAACGAVFEKDINSTILQDIYWNILKNYNDEDVERSFKMAVDKCKFFPRPAELIEFIVGDSKKNADIKWAGIMELMRKHEGLRNEKVMVDGATAFAVRNMGGWSDLTMMNTDKLPFQAPRFRALYEQACSIGLDREVGEIEGRIERHWQTKELLQQRLITTPETIRPPKQALEIESPERTLIEHKIQAEIKRLAAGKSLQKVTS